MSEPVRILGFAGSLRRQSFNRYALEAAKSLLPKGAVLDTIGLDGIPAFNQDEEKSFPPAAAKFKEAIRKADALLIVTPEYNYSMPGVLKNAIDWASRPYGDSAFTGKTAAIMGASVGVLGTARAQYHLRQCFIFLDVPLVNKPEVMIGNAADHFDDQGKLKNDKTKELIGKLLQSLVALTLQQRQRPS
jgi:chromate reductase